jgi:hypothetical protein
MHWVEYKGRVPASTAPIRVWRPFDSVHSEGWRYTCPNPMLTYDLKDGITFSVAVLGAVLGVINTWHGFNQSKVKLRVIPKYAFSGDGGDEGVYHATISLERTGFPKEGEMGCIEVTNLSAFPVNISEIGFTVRGHPRKDERVFVKTPITLDGKTFARRLESRASVHGHFALNKLTPDIRKAYAVTDCGEVAYGTSPALKEIVSRLRESSSINT